MVPKGRECFKKKEDAAKKSYERLIHTIWTKEHRTRELFWWLGRVRGSFPHMWALQYQIVNTAYGISVVLG